MTRFDWILSGVWHHYVVVVTAGGNIKVYINGTFATDNYHFTTVSSPFDDGEIRIGKKDATDATLDLYVDEVYFWQEAKDGPFISDLYNMYWSVHVNKDLWWQSQTVIETDRELKHPPAKET